MHLQYTRCPIVPFHVSRNHGSDWRSTVFPKCTIQLKDFYATTQSKWLYRNTSVWLRGTSCGSSGVLFMTLIHGKLLLQEEVLMIMGSLLGRPHNSVLAIGTDNGFDSSIIVPCCHGTSPNRPGASLGGLCTCTSFSNRSVITCTHLYRPNWRSLLARQLCNSFSGTVSPEGVEGRATWGPLSCMRCGQT